MNQPEAWDAEYRRGGIPSSVRDDPSGVLLWTLSNWLYLTGKRQPNDVIDVGCGTGRNATYIASLGASVMGFDFSSEAIRVAHKRSADLEDGLRPVFVRQDLSVGIPASDAGTDLITDIFVYKHQLDARARADYRRELRRVLRPEGKLLMSFADVTDDYYSRCPTYEPPGADTSRNPLTIIDMPILIGSVLFRIEDIIKEMSDTFRLEMSWHKEKTGMMHGELHLRRTVASIWSPIR